MAIKEFLGDADSINNLDNIINELVDILVSYDVSVKYNNDLIYAHKDIGEVALIFDILKFNKTFLVRIFFEDCTGDLTEIWERDILLSDETKLYELVGKMEKVFKLFECHVLENGSVNELVLFKNTLDIVD